MEAKCMLKNLKDLRPFIKYPPGSRAPSDPKILTFLDTAFNIGKIQSYGRTGIFKRILFSFNDGAHFMSKIGRAVSNIESVIRPISHRFWIVRMQMIVALISRMQFHSWNREVKYCIKARWIAENAMIQWLHLMQQETSGLGKRLSTFVIFFNQKNWIFLNLYRVEQILPMNLLKEIYQCTGWWKEKIALEKYSYHLKSFSPYPLQWK